MGNIEQRPPMSIEKQHGGKIIATVGLLDPATQKEQVLIVLRSETTKKIMLLLRFNPIEFDTQSGKQTWINGFGLLDRTSFILIDDGSFQSLGIHRYDGSRASLGFDSPHGTPEVVYRIRAASVSAVGGDPFLLSAALGSIYDLPAYGPE